MPMHDEKNVIVNDCILLWDGITNPEQKENGGTKWSVKVALPNTDPQIHEVNAIVQKELLEGAFKGTLPPNGRTPIHPFDPTKMDGRLPAHVAFSAGTHQGCPEVFDLNDNKLDPLTYGPMLYPGAHVDVLISAWTYDDPRNKGIALNVNGLRIRDPKAPRLPVGSGVDAGRAFATSGSTAGGGGAPVMTAKAAGASYESFIAAGWTDAQLIDEGYIQPPQVAVQAPPVAQAVPAAVQAPPVAVAPPAAVQAPPVAQAVPAAVQAPQMTAKAAGAPYESFVSAGWTDAQLVAEGYMIGPASGFL